MKLDLTGKRALVCGGSGGIGRAAAMELAELGCEVTVLARSKEALDTTVEALRSAGAPAAHALAVDLDDLDGAVAIVAAHLKDVGDHHILVNNTGGPPGGPLLAAQDDDFLVPYKRHLLAAQRLTNLLLPGMKTAGYGRIVNVLSTSVREPIPGLGVSNTIRASVASWAKTLSRELPPGVTINSILPGFTDTDRLSSLGAAVAERTGTTPETVRQGWIDVTPEGRLGRPEELGAAVAWLCTPAAGFVRGVVLPVDGGRLNSI
ncbi:MAG: SDR family oxidoreductase [Thermoplasmatota archaeon]